MFSEVMELSGCVLHSEADYDPRLRNDSHKYYIKLEPISSLALRFYCGLIY